MAKLFIKKYSVIQPLHCLFHMRPNNHGSREPEVMEAEGESGLFDPLSSNRNWFLSHATQICWLNSRWECKVGAIHEPLDTELDAGGTGPLKAIPWYRFLKVTTEPQNNLVFTVGKCSTNDKLIIILVEKTVGKWILRKSRCRRSMWVCGLDYCGSGSSPISGSCEHANAPSCSANPGIFLISRVTIRYMRLALCDEVNWHRRQHRGDSKHLARKYKFWTLLL